MEEVRTTYLFRSKSPVLFSRYHNTEKLDGEIPEDYEDRTWRERCHFDEDNEVIIPGYLIQKTLEAAAKLTGERVGGKKQGKGLSHFLATIRVEGDIKTGIRKKNVKGHPAFVSANGQPTGGRVMRIFPKIDEWKGKLTLVYPDLGILNSQIIKKYLEIAGSCIGVGHWRPSSPSRGSYGLFEARRCRNAK